MAKTRVAVEFGIGTSLRRKDYTKAAISALKDALWHNSLSMSDAFGFDNSDMIIATTKQMDIIQKQMVIQSKSLDEITILAAEKEKLLAAHRAGIKEVLIPKENEKDLVDMPKKIIDDIKITPVDHADQVLKVALTKELKRTEWVEVDISKKDDKSQASIQ